MTPDELKAELGELNPHAVLWTGFDEALLGIGQQFNKFVAVYSYTGMIRCLLQSNDEVEYTDAVEHIHVNALGQYTGEFDPIVLFDEHMR